MTRHSVLWEDGEQGGSAFTSTPEQLAQTLRALAKLAEQRQCIAITVHPLTAQVRNLLVRRAQAQRVRRFDGGPITGFGELP